MNTISLGKKTLSISRENTGEFSSRLLRSEVLESLPNFRRMRRRGVRAHDVPRVPLCYSSYLHSLSRLDHLREYIFGRKANITDSLQSRQTTREPHLCFENFASSEFVREHFRTSR